MGTTVLQNGAPVMAGSRINTAKRRALTQVSATTALCAQIPTTLTTTTTTTTIWVKIFEACKVAARHAKSPTVLQNEWCTNSAGWTKNEYCQQSCFGAGFGYDGIVCCDTSGTTIPWQSGEACNDSSSAR